MIKELDGNGLEIVSGGRRGISCRVPPLNYRACARIKNDIESSLAVNGSRLFNCLPAELRELTSLRDSRLVWINFCQLFQIVHVCRIIPSLQVLTVF